MLYDLVVKGYNYVETNGSTSILMVLTLGLIYWFIIYPLYISPLRNIPGPYLFRISRLPALHYQRTNKWILYVHELHKKYGPVVVLSPKEISVNEDLKFLKDIYTKNFPKSKFYENFRNHGNKDNMFASLENDRHINYRKIISPIYSKSAVFNNKNIARNIIIKKITELIKDIRESSVEGNRPDYINGASEVNIHGFGHSSTDKKWFMKNKKDNKNLGIDVYSLFGSLALDVVSAFELGNENGTDLLESPIKREIITYHRYVASMGFYTTLMPKLWNYAATTLILKSAEIVENWQLKLYDNAEKNVPQVKQDENLTTLETLKKNGLKGKYAYSFLSDNIFAGHETTAIQLTYLTYELSRPKHQYLQRLLKNELDEFFGKPTNDSIIDNFEIIDKLPILDALILENSRVHTSIPGAEPRVVDKMYKIDDVTIPVGTVISVQPYSYHRVESIFPNPDNFIPERWLKSNNESDKEYEQRIKLQHKYMIPFGKGIRMCLGINIAQIEMKLAIANIYWHFNSGICENWCEVVNYNDSVKLPLSIKMGDTFVGDNRTDEEKMTMFDSYTTRPFNDECWLEFYHN